MSLLVIKNSFHVRWKISSAVELRTLSNRAYRVHNLLLNDEICLKQNILLVKNVKKQENKFRKTKTILQ